MRLRKHLHQPAHQVDDRTAERAERQVDQSRPARSFAELLRQVERLILRTHARLQTVQLESNGRAPGAHAHRAMEELSTDLASSLQKYDEFELLGEASGRTAVCADPGLLHSPMNAGGGDHLHAEWI